MKRCPICSSEYEDTFKVCPRDGTTLDEGTIAMVAPSLQETKPVGDPMIGTTIAGRFRIVGKLGEGGMGAVYKAEHTKMDRLSAIKILSTKMAHDADAVARFTREANMSSRIDHPNAVTIYDYGEAENGLVYLAMEYIDGHTLSSVLRSTGPMGLERTLNIARQIGEALEAAHALTIVHRDLKPDNVMLTKKGTTQDYVKVLDFGIAKMSGEDKRTDLTQAGLVIGTPFYMSPEQVAGEKLDPRSDVFSFALIVYEMLSGRLPFGGENTQAVMISRLTQQPTPLRQMNPQIPEAVEDAVMRALTRDREMRTKTAAQFVEEIENAILGRDKAATQAHRAINTAGLETQQGSAAIAPAPTPQNLTIPTAPGDPYATTPAAQAQTPVPPPPPAFLPTDRAVPAGPPSASPFSAPTAPVTGQASAPARPYAQTPAKSGSGAGKLIAAVLVIGFVVVLGGGAIGLFLFKDRIFGGSPGDVAQTGGGTTAGTGGLGTDVPVAAESAQSHFDKGTTLFQSGNYSAAAAEFRKATELDPSLAKAHANLGAALVELRSNGEAKAALNKAVSLDATNGKAHYNLGLAHFRLKEYKEAAVAFQKAATLEEDPVSHAYAGFALDNAGDKAGAKAAYEKYLELFPKYQQARPTEDSSTADYVREILAGRNSAPNGDEV